MTKLIDLFTSAALDAGRAILEVYRAGPTTSYKADCSPVTEADEQAERIILEALRQAVPDIPVIAEEAVAAGRIPAIGGGPFILVDPLDGTKEFIAGRDEFTVNIALIRSGVPVAGVVYAPALGIVYTGDGDVAYRLTIGADFSVDARKSIRVREAAPSMVAVASRSHSTPETEAFLKANNIAETCAIGSSLKFCLVAEGQADIYPRLSRTMEWDTAAGDAVLRAAGGTTTTLDVKPLVYGKTQQTDNIDFANPYFIARGGLQKSGFVTRSVDPTP
jgi:3'(2'), 5'-bisphosphate nucleotidase